MQLKIKILNFLQKTSFLQILLISLLTPIIAQEVVVVDNDGVAENTEMLQLFCVAGHTKRQIKHFYKK